MKKSKLLIAAVASLALSGCSIEDLMFWKKKDDSKPKSYKYKVEMEGGSADEQEAILNAINKKAVCVDTKEAQELFPDTERVLKENDGANIKLTTSQAVKINSKSYTVSLKWGADQNSETNPYFKGLLTSDEIHQIIEVDYKGYGVEDGEISWYLESATCGEAKTKGDVALNYKATTRNQIYFFEDAYMSKPYVVHDEELTVKEGKDDDDKAATHKFPSTWDVVDYSYKNTKYSPYFKSNNEDNPNPEAKKKYLYYNMPGRVIYLAPDGNFGLIADGEQVMEIYQGSGEGIPLKAENFPNLAKEYVRISGNMGQYCGNVQFGFITKVVEATADELEHETPAELNFRELSEEQIASLTVEGYTAQKQAVVMDGICLSNSLKKVTGTFVAGSIKDKSGEKIASADAIEKGNRFTFDLQVGSQVMTVAFDYHVDKDGSHGIFNALKTALKAGGKMEIKGTMRYSGENENPFVYEGNKGVWNIVPFAPEHVSSVA